MPVAALVPVDEPDLEPRHWLAHRARAHVVVLHHGARAGGLRQTVSLKDNSRGMLQLLLVTTVSYDDINLYDHGAEAGAQEPVGLWGERRAANNDQAEAAAQDGAGLVLNGDVIDLCHNVEMETYSNYQNLPKTTNKIYL